MTLIDFLFHLHEVIDVGSIAVDEKEDRKLEGITAKIGKKNNDAA